jgi:hypothetical protein
MRRLGIVAQKMRMISQYERRIPCRTENGFLLEGPSIVCFPRSAWFVDQPVSVWNRRRTGIRSPKQGFQTQT